MNILHSFNHQLIRHLVCFHYLPIINKSVMNICYKVFAWTFSFHFSFISHYLGVELLGQLVTLHRTSLLRNCQTVFPKWLHWLYECSNFFTSLSRLSLLFEESYLVGVKWNLTVVLICISLVANNAEHFLMYSLATCISSLEEHLSILLIF